MLWRNAGEHVGIFNHIPELGIVQLIEVGTSQYFSAAAHQSNLLRDGTRGVGIISSDHHRADSGVTRLLERIFNFFTRRVNHPNQSHKNQIFFQRVPFCVLLLNIAIGQRKHAQRVTRHCIIGFINFFPNVLLEFVRLIIHGLIGPAKRKNDLRRAFNGDQI